VDEPERLPAATWQVPLVAESTGFVGDVDAMAVALAALGLGAGRTRAADRIDPAVGVTALVKRGERVERGAPLCVIHANDPTALAKAKAALARAIVVTHAPAADRGGPALACTARRARRLPGGQHLRLARRAQTGP